MNYSNKINKLRPLLLLLLLASGIASFQLEKEEFSFAQEVELKDLEKLQAEIKLNAGQLHLSTHTSSRASLDATYTQARWKPEIFMDQQNSRLSIRQPEDKNSNMEDGDQNAWKVVLPKKLPSDLKIIMGAGQGNVNLSGSSLNKVEVEMGAGQLELNLANASLSLLKVSAGVGQMTIDLSGQQDKNLEAIINGGVGAIDLVLPRRTGVRVKANGLGSVNSHELRKDGGYYVNDLYGETANNIEVEVNGGLGSVELSLK